MFSKRKLLALLLATVALSGSSIAQAGTSVDEQFQVTPPPGVGYTGYLVNNTRSLVRMDSFLVTFRVAGGKIAAMKPCDSLANCPNTFDAQVADLNLRFCNKKIQIDCISGLSTTNTKTGQVSNEFKTRLSETQDFTARVIGDTTQGLPEGGNPQVVSIPSAPHQGGDLYLIKTDYFASRRSNSEPFKLALLTSAIYPITIERGKFTPGGPNLDPKAYVGQNASGGGAPKPPFISAFLTDPRCLMATESVCLVPQAFPENIAFGLKLKLSQSFNGWLYGRLANPAVSVISGTGNSKSVEVSISAEPVKVPVPFGWVKNSELPTELLTKYESDRSGGLYLGKNARDPLDQVSILKGHSNNYTDGGIEEMISWMPKLSDRASAMPSQWSFQTLDLRSDTAAVLSRCTNSVKSLAGLIFTNATVFSAGAPTFDSATGNLDYKVAAPHFKPDGIETTTGSYDLVLNSEVARCIYGFTKAPVSASISIENSGGENKVASTSVIEKNGFLRLAAYGFGFSAPKIKIKLSQSEGVGATSATKPKTAINKITCKNGTKLRTVSGATPKCPTGWTLKK
jgi:hypothetical protein